MDANALLCTGNNASSVSNGYIPASIMWTVGTQQKGYDILVNSALEPGLTIIKNEMHRRAFFLVVDRGNDLFILGMGVRNGVLVFGHSDWG